jgi:predicted nucleic acid-binding protein
VPWAILDSNVYIEHWQGRLAQDALRSLHAVFVVRQSAVVLSELRRGARTKEARSLVESLRAMATSSWEPNADDWWEAGQLILALGDRHGWDSAKRRDFQNDARKTSEAAISLGRQELEGGPNW